LIGKPEIQETTMSAVEIPKHILDAADITAITQLIILERESRDQQRWKTMRECFHDDALIRVSWITGNADEFVNGSIDMAKRGMPAKHRLGPILVRLNTDRAVATLGGVIDIPVQVGGVDSHLSSYTRFFYKAERRDDRWKLSGFDAAYVRDELVPTIPGQTLRVAPEDLVQYRKSYRMLCYVLSNHGYQVNSNLPGDDRPDTVRSLETQLFSWAGVQP
jgi:hypothetical protein